MKLQEAAETAARLISILEPACERMAIAGSIRREKPVIGDIELVALPRFQTDLWGQPLYRQPLCLDDLLRRHIADGVLAWDATQKRDGAKWKRLIVREGDGVAIDLFLAEHGNWGNTLAIRTGNAKFSEMLMVAAQRQKLRHHDGYLWRTDAVTKAQGTLESRVECPTEEAFFEAIGLEWIPPDQRTDATARQIFEGQWRRKAARKG